MDNQNQSLESNKSQTANQSSKDASSKQTTGKRKYLKIAPGWDLDAPVNSLFGKIITYIHNSPDDNQSLVLELFKVRFAPLVLERNSPHYQLFALQCAITLEGWAREIREYAGLSIPFYSIPTIITNVPFSNSVTVPVTPPVTATEVNKENNGFRPLNSSETLTDEIEESDFESEQERELVQRRRADRALMNQILGKT